MNPLTPRLPSHARETIQQFLRAHALQPPAGGIVVGLSGGIDSALTARLARDALGGERVLGVLLPDAGYPSGLLRETEEYAESLGIEHRTIPIDAGEAGVRSLVPELADRVDVGNVKARLRMIVNYALARPRHYLVAGPGNKSELLVGYFTKYGDGGADLLPLGDLYKTEVRALSEQLEIPAGFLERAPTAGLWEGQTDEAELGLTYDELDRILHGLEQLFDPDEIARRGDVPIEKVRSVEERIRATRHKRRLPPIPKLSLRTVGLDWRE
jgi:NAD+ synthase